MALRKRKRKMVCVFVAARSEYELLRPVIFLLKKTCDVKMVAAGMLLSPEYGYAIDDIQRDGLSVHKRVETLPGSDLPMTVSKSMALGLLGMADCLAEWQPDLLIVLGERYETLAACCAAMNQFIPIAHINGGETTLGSGEEGTRHAITKMSYLHFAGTEIYRKRIIQLGEAPDRVFNVGVLALEKILQTELIKREALEKYLGVALDKPYAVVTFQPAPLEKMSVAKQFAQVLKALRRHRELTYVFTYAEAGAYGRVVNEMIGDFVKSHQKAAVFASLGGTEYLSVLKHAEMVIGNSAAGIYEAPILGIPTVNVGDRQKGRLQSGSVLNCLAEADTISKAMKKARDPLFLKNMDYRSALYGDGECAQRIVGVIEDFLEHDRIDLKKEFYDFL